MSEANFSDNKKPQPRKKLDDPNVLSDSFLVSSKSPEQSNAQLTPALVRGEQFARYVIEKELGRGGMGVVYKAFDPQLRRVVALKIVLQANSQDIKRFCVESAAMAQLNHPGITSLYEFSETPHPHFTMEYIDGCTLADLIKQKNIKPLFLINVLIEVCSALAHAHQHNIIHRDIKPSNIMLTKNGQAKIMDFGLAKVSDFNESLSKTGDILGSIHYMAPEQINGKATFQSDIYSFGASMYEALTYQRLYGGETIQNILFEILHKDVVLPRQITPTISPYIEAVCLKCLEKKPRKRYDSFKQLTRELKNLKNNRPIIAKPYTTWYSLRLIMRRHRLLWLGIIGLAFAILITVVITKWKLSEPSYIENVKKANALYDLGEQQQALMLYDKVISQNPDYAIAYTKRAIIYINLNTYDKALLDLNEAITLAPEKPDNYKYRGDIFYRLHKYKNALNDYSRVISIEPNYGVYVKRSNIYRLLRRYDEAINDLDKAIAIDPEKVDAYGMKGNVYVHLGKSEAAIKNYHRVIAINPNDKFVYGNIAVIYIQKKQYSEALENLNKAIELGNDNIKTHYKRAQVYYNLKKYSKAIVDLNKVIESQPNLTECYHFRGRCYYHLQQYRAANTNFTRVITFSNNWEAYLYRSFIYIATGNYEKGMQDLDNVIALHPQNFVICLKKGLQFYFKQQYTKALQNFNIAISQNTNYVSLYFYRSRIYQYLNKYPLALKDMNVVVEVQSTAKMYSIRGDLLLAAHKYKLAVKDWKKALSLGHEKPKLLERKIKELQKKLSQKGK